jgi:iron complex transport system substrate-binding protein
MQSCWAALGVALLVATQIGTGTAAVSARDDTGATIELAAPAQRIVSLAPHATELLFAAGAGARITGVVARSDFPPQAKAIPVVGDVNTIDLERIVAQKPDLVVTWPYTTPALVEKLKARGIAVFTTDPASLDGIADDIVALGTLAGTRDAAVAAATSWKARLDALARGARGKPSVLVFYQIWDAPLFTVGHGHLITQALAACGAENVFGAIRIPAPQVSAEAVLAARPEAIIAGADGAVRPAWLDRWRRWTELPAVRYGNLDVVDADRLHRPGPRFLDGMQALCEAIDRARARRADTK